MGEEGKKEGRKREFTILAPFICLHEDMDGIQMYARSACTALSGYCLVCVLFIFYAASASCREGTGGYVNVKEESLPLPLRVNIWTIHDAANTVLIVPLFN